MHVILRVLAIFMTGHYMIINEDEEDECLLAAIESDKDGLNSSPKACRSIPHQLVCVFVIETTENRQTLTRLWIYLSLAPCHCLSLSVLIRDAPPSAACARSAT